MILNRVGVSLFHGDCADVLRDLPDASIDACVTDPPYGIDFMGAGWDSDVPPAGIWQEVLRVLKPGGHLLAFAGTRTQHRMATRIEDAGFEIRDLLMWVYGSGFPKSHNLDGAHEGWGTALKPALEPITMARKPLAGTVAANVAQFGPGALNIDGCRVGVDDAEPNRRNSPSIDRTGGIGGSGILGGGAQVERAPTLQHGRWPANLIHDGSDEVVSAFPETCSGIPSQGDRNGNVYGTFGRRSLTSPGDRAGSAARFFYCAKASKADRDDGMTGPDRQVVQFQTANGTSGKASSLSDGRDTRRKNHHPTVKPTELMRYLCRLITPPGGLILDPFMGSGSTGRGAVLEGFGFIGVEREVDYITMARDRIAAAQKLADEQSRQAVLL